MISEIVDKVQSGVLTGSREREVNQSYFNFLYGRDEVERYTLLCDVRDGKVKPKDIKKVRF